jgi:hypothetical protein
MKLRSETQIPLAVAFWRQPIVVALNAFVPPKRGSVDRPVGVLRAPRAGELSISRSRLPQWPNPAECFGIVTVQRERNAGRSGYEPAWRTAGREEAIERSKDESLRSAGTGAAGLRQLALRQCVNSRCAKMSRGMSLESRSGNALRRLLKKELAVRLDA